jgi:ATP-dependent Lon protease
MEFVESDQRDREGLIEGILNPDVLKRCLKLLEQLWKQIQQDGFNLQLDERILEQIYGHRDENHLRKDLYESYHLWLATSEAPEEKRLRKHFASPEQCRTNVLQDILEEIRRLSRDQQAGASVQTARTQLEIVCRNIPDGPGLDRLLRYEASLERFFDRTLNQLERLRRTRLGQPVLPTIEVRHSRS